MKEGIEMGIFQTCNCCSTTLESCVGQLLCMTDEEEHRQTMDPL